jgi:hypothetical protein
MTSSLSTRSPQQCPFSRFRSRWSAPAALALVAALAILSACSSSTANTSGTPTATATIAPTPTPKPKPTSVPTTSVAYCQGLLSLAEVNSIMKPPTPATNILFENDTSGGLNACSWATGQTIAVLAVFFVPFPSGASLNSIAQRLAKASITTTPVSGVGDQALYLSATLPTPSGPDYAADLVVAYGRIVIGCAQTGAGSLPAALQSEMTRACKLVVSRL